MKEKEMRIEKKQCCLHDPAHGIECSHVALIEVERVCQERGLRLTPIRRRVLELVWQKAVPTGAYDLLHILASEGYSYAPPTIYRALDFLLENGFIHKIERLNAFIGCVRPQIPHRSHFMICTECHNTTELHDGPVQALIMAEATHNDFQVSHHIIEIEGICRSCQAITL